MSKIRHPYIHAVQFSVAIYRAILDGQPPAKNDLLRSYQKALRGGATSSVQIGIEGIIDHYQPLLETAYLASDLVRCGELVCLLSGEVSAKLDNAMRTLEVTDGLSPNV